MRKSNRIIRNFHKRVYQASLFGELFFQKLWLFFFPYFVNNKFVSHSSEVWKFRIKVLINLISLESSLLCLQMASFSLCPYIGLFSVVFASLVSLPLLIRTPVILNYGPILMTLLNLNYFFKGSISKYSHNGGLGFNIWIWGVHNSVHNTRETPQMRKVNSKDFRVRSTSRKPRLRFILNFKPHFKKKVNIFWWGF